MKTFGIVITSLFFGIILGSFSSESYQYKAKHAFIANEYKLVKLELDALKPDYSAKIIEVEKLKVYNQGLVDENKELNNRLSKVRQTLQTVVDQNQKIVKERNEIKTKFDNALIKESNWKDAVKHYVSF